MTTTAQQPDDTVAAANASCHVLVITTNAFIGGGEIFLINLLPRLMARGLRITVLAPEAGPFTERLAQLHISFEIAPWQHHTKLGLLRQLRGNIALWRRARRLRPDILFALCPQAAVHAVAACLCLRIPLHIDVHTLIDRIPSGSRRVLNRLVRPSTFFKTRHVQILNPIFNEGEWVPLGIPFHPPAPPRTGAGKVIAFFGRLERAKCVDRLIKAFLKADLPNTVLRIYGAATDSDYEQELLDLASGQPTISFEGETDQVIPAMKKTDLIVVPSNSESASMVALEAMQLGRAVICTNIGGPSEFIRHGENACLFFSPDIADLAQLMRQLITDDVLRNRIAQAATQLPEKYNIQRVADRYVDQFIQRTVQTPN